MHGVMASIKIIYALFLGIQILISISTTNVLIIGDSLLVTCKHTISQDALSERMQLYQVNNLIKQLSTYSLLHFKRENNAKVEGGSLGQLGGGLLVEHMTHGSYLFLSAQPFCRCAFNSTGTLCLELFQRSECYMSACGLV